MANPYEPPQSEIIRRKRRLDWLGHVIVVLGVIGLLVWYFLPLFQLLVVAR